MNSAVYYKFKSQKAESRIPIDGTGISVFDLKREIILANGLDKALDIDLQVFNQLGDEGVSCCLYTRCCS
jgi:protein MPE1